jgi:hypothetical protein
VLRLADESSADECALIGQRTALVNQLQAALKEYYPSALEWFSDWTSPTAWDFVLTFPRPEALQRASRRKACGFLRAHHTCLPVGMVGLTPLWQGRVDQRDQAAAWPSDPPTVEAKEFLAVALAKQLRTLQANLEAYRKRIEELYQQHPDAFLFSSLPGAGPKLGPRLLTHFGTDRDRFTPACRRGRSAQSLQQLSGTVPVTRQSGRRRDVVIRRACQKPFRKTMHLFAFQTIERSAWARAFYDQARQAGQPHSLALRNLASKWPLSLWSGVTPARQGSGVAQGDLPHVAGPRALWGEHVPVLTRPSRQPTRRPTRLGGRRWKTGG